MHLQVVATAGESQRAWYLVLTGTLELTPGASSGVAAAAAAGHPVSLPTAASALSLARARLRAAAVATALSASARAGAGLARSGTRQGLCPMAL